jgi:starvation-inducible DNA-binding protein
MSRKHEHRAVLELHPEPPRQLQAYRTVVSMPIALEASVSVQLARLLHAHEVVLKEARAMARQAAEAGDDGINDLLVSQVIRTNKRHVWFVAEHLVDAPLTAHDE